MAEAFECDRCSRFEGGKPELKVQITASRPPVQSEMKELCTPCAVELKEWMTEAKYILDKPEAD